MKPTLFGVCLLAALPFVAAAQEPHEAYKLAGEDGRPSEAPLEIVREKMPGEKANFQLHAGDDVVFVVQRQGLPVPNARVRLVTEQGWAKETLTDAQGRARFQLIRDYFPSWLEFNKRNRSAFVVAAENPAPGAGRDQDRLSTNVPSQATLSDSYSPSPEDYSSYAWGLAIGLLVAAVGGTSVYLYRRRRVKPFREVAFHEGR